MNWWKNGPYLHSKVGWFGKPWLLFNFMYSIVESQLKKVCFFSLTRSHSLLKLQRWLHFFPKNKNAIESTHFRVLRTRDFPINLLKYTSRFHRKTLLLLLFDFQRAIARKLRRPSLFSLLFLCLLCSLVLVVAYFGSQGNPMVTVYSHCTLTMAIFNIIWPKIRALI